MNRLLLHHTYIDIIAAIFITLFGYTSAVKFRDQSEFIASMIQVPLLKPLATQLAMAVPMVELLVTILLFFPRSRYWGLMAATGLICLFTIYIAYIMLTMNDLPCSCGGVIRQLSWGRHLALNIALLLAGGSCILIHKRSIAINRSSRIPV
jgi:hypothetical protein